MAEPIPLDEQPALVQQACATYSDDALLLAHCVTRTSRGLSTRAELDRACALAGNLEGECRQHWVLRQLMRAPPPPRDELLAACGADLDCRFLVLDDLPADSFDQQVEDCRLVGRYGHSCVRHATTRWLESEPDAAEVERFSGASLYQAGLVAEQVARRVGCDGVGRCAPEGAAYADCARWVEIYRSSPERCTVRPLDRPPPPPR